MNILKNCAILFLNLIQFEIKKRFAYFVHFWKVLLINCCISWFEDPLGAFRLFIRRAGFSKLRLLILDSNLWLTCERLEKKFHCFKPKKFQSSFFMISLHVLMYFSSKKGITSFRISFLHLIQPYIKKKLRFF